MEVVVVAGDVKGTTAPSSSRNGVHDAEAVGVAADGGVIAFDEPTSAPVAAAGGPVPAPGKRRWRTGVCDCDKDEEVCWWGCWCNNLVQVRTAHQFDAATSRKQMTLYWTWTGLVLVGLLLGSVFYAYLLFVAGIVYIACNRVTIRRAIRTKLGIQGTCFDDCCVQCCCCCCGICQEAREAKAMLASTPGRHVDLCSGEDLSGAEEKHQRAIGHHGGGGAGVDSSVHSVGGTINTSSPVGSRDADDPALPEGGTCASHFALVSQTSKIILVLWAGIACASVWYVCAMHRPTDVAVLLLVFVQPLVLLYVVYWRARRAYVSIDYVIKCFAVGFWMAPVQAVLFESVLQTVVGLAFLPLLGSFGGVEMLLSAGTMTDDQAAGSAATAAATSAAVAGAATSLPASPFLPTPAGRGPVAWDSGLQAMLGLLTGGTGTPRGGLAGAAQRGVSGVARRVSVAAIAHLHRAFFSAPATSSPSPSSSSSASFSSAAAAYGPHAQHSWLATPSALPALRGVTGAATLPGYTPPPPLSLSPATSYLYASALSLSTGNSTAYSAGAGDDGMPQSIEYLGRQEVFRLLLQHNMFWVVLLLWLNAFVVAAGVEETVKHFVVRCCPFPSALRDPPSALVYLVAGALGFATCENIEYVFGAGTESAIPGTSVFAGELLVLLMRVLMPVHVICAVLQATGLARTLVGEAQLSLFRILLPGLVVHGSFDFLLFLGGAIDYIYAFNSVALEVTFLVAAVTLAVAGACWAYCSYKKVEKDFNHGWQAFAQEEADDDIEMIVL